MGLGLLTATRSEKDQRKTFVNFKRFISPDFFPEGLQELKEKI